MAMSDDDATKRAKLMGEINEVCADMEGLQVRKQKVDAELEVAQAEMAKALNKHRSEVGTINKEGDKLAEKYARLRKRLDGLMPVVPLGPEGMGEQTLDVREQEAR